MKKLTLDDLQGLQRYEESRNAFRAHIIEVKKSRRVSVGGLVSFVFENHATILFQIQEMLRAEHIVDIDKVREELAVYNALLPGTSELSATMLIEITDGTRAREQLHDLIGIDECVHLNIGGTVSIQAMFEPGRSTDEKLSAVQYVRFALDPTARSAFMSASEVRLAITHPHYEHQAVLPAAIRQSLAADLTTE